MDHSRFDALARGLAASATRRAGLRAALGALLGGALPAGALATAGGESEAGRRRKRRRCDDGRARCAGACCEPTHDCIDGSCQLRTGTVIGCASTADCPNDLYCRYGACFCRGMPSTIPCGAGLACCPADRICSSNGPEGVCVPRWQVRCDDSDVNARCPDGARCQNGACVCPDDDAICGETCCGFGRSCCNGACCAGDCCKGTCCVEGSVCRSGACRTDDGLICVPRGEWCGGGGEDHCCGENVCCSYYGIGVEYLCCDPGNP